MDYFRKTPSFSRLLLLLILSGIAGLFGWWCGDRKNTIPDSSGSRYNRTHEIFVHVAGEVNSPGLYTVAEGTRIGNLVQLAGGVTDKADLTDINLAESVKDEEKIFIPRRQGILERVGSSSQNMSFSFLPFR